MQLAQLYALWKSCSGFTTDTRQLKPGYFFIALRGERFDANTFAQQALDAGAAYVLIDNPNYQLNERCLLVENTLSTLQALAAYHRQHFHIPVIAICGSNGKTTTKELTHAVLATTHQVHATAGNLNNHIGVPLTLLRMPETATIAVIEMGANHLNETAELCAIAQPTHGIITNNGKDHLEGFGSIEQVKKANAELYDYLEQTKGIAFVNAADDDLMQFSQPLQRVLYNTTTGHELSGQLMNAFPVLYGAIQLNQSALEFTSALAGEYNLVNILAAAAIGHYFNVADAAIKAAIEAYQPGNNRSQWMKWNGNEILMDCYNANPSSMAIALQSFSKMPVTNKMAVLGDMFELGEYSFQEHALVLAQAKASGINQLVFVGKEWLKHKSEAIGVWFETTEAAKVWLKQQAIQNQYILVKGSRGMALEKLFE